ncbi:hypothetical protein [Sphingomonas sp. R1]|uniref:hypothetical protein n=1 Tax=Sphingomonas sp. R1 TaxID=399176 RepID=UPI0022246793|nr:hypothetical protein [Sphingomonas sp. R1]UYY78401.1 hypothetical protein OIM94_05200 [Sphingomonas sp. R1]
MISLITGAFRALHKWAGNSWLVLIAMGIATACLYVDTRRTRADRDAWASWARETCAHAGAGTDAATIERKDAAGRTHKVRMPRGAVCREAVQDLAKFRADTLAATARVLGAAAAEREAKSSRDLVAARVETGNRAAALTTMEKADAQIRDDDRVDGNWFAALNRLGGLQPPD